MSFKSKVTSKLATLEAARTIFFIVVGLGIKESLTLFSSPPPPRVREWHKAALIIVSLGYLITAIRFIHGVSTLHGHEKWQIENTNLPSSRRILSLSLFIVLLAVTLYLMAINITDFQRYVCFTATMIVVDLLMIGFSEVVSYPLSPKTVFGRKDNTAEGYPPRAAIQWIRSDLVLFITANVLLIYNYSDFGAAVSNFAAANFYAIPIQAFWGLALIAVSIWDYYTNRAFYFGGETERRKQKFVFVCSPLTPPKEMIGNEKEKELKKNINLAQLYCHQLTAQKSRFSKEITPYAAHCFYTYFLSDKIEKQRVVSRQCAIAYLAACDAIYVYLPDKTKTEISGINSSGMKHEIGEAKKKGLQIVYKQIENLENLPEQWDRPDWKSPQCKKTDEEEHSITMKNKDKSFRIEYTKDKNDPQKSTVDFEGNVLRKRVYVCTNLRGRCLTLPELLKEEEITRKTIVPDPELTERAIEKFKQRMNENVKKTLWQCYNLAMDDKAFLAPFAPQAFFPYFWSFPIKVEKKADQTWHLKESENWNTWFNKSKEILKVCDAVYIYSEDGLPDSKNISEGMKEISRLAEKLGMEIIYKKEREIKEIKDECEIALPNFEPIVSTAQQSSNSADISQN